MENEERFFSEIEDTLHAHEDAYLPGAWESFQKERKRRPALLWWAVSGAAAVLLVFLLVQFFAQAPKTGDNNLIGAKNHPPQNVQPTTITPAGPSVPGPDTLAPATPGTLTGEAITARKDPAKATSDRSRQQVAPPAGIPPKAIAKNFYPDSAATLAANNTVKKNSGIAQPDQNVVNTDSVAGNLVTGSSPDRVIAKTEPKKYTGNSTRSVYDSLVKAKTGGNPIATVVKSNERNLSYSLVLSPSLGNQKVNFGTGVEVNYKINKNFFVSSGLAYSSLTANAGGISNNATRKVQGVNLAVSGVEVPLGLQYRTSSGFYVSAGVLAMSVTNNSLQYDYVTESTVAVPSYSSTGLVQQTLRVVSEQKTEQSEEKINNYLGFYMFSVGKKKAIGKTQLNFGPFIRVPFGGVSSQKIQLMQGGIHLGLDF